MGTCVFFSSPSWRDDLSCEIINNFPWRHVPPGLKYRKRSGPQISGNGRCTPFTSAGASRMKIYICAVRTGKVKILLSFDFYFSLLAFFAPSLLFPFPWSSYCSLRLRSPECPRVIFPRRSPLCSPSTVYRVETLWPPFSVLSSPASWQTQPSSDESVLPELQKHEIVTDRARRPGKQGRSQIDGFSTLYQKA